jgi:hypothetical protein
LEHAITPIIPDDGEDLEFDEDSLHHLHQFSSEIMRNINDVRRSYIINKNEHLIDTIYRFLGNKASVLPQRFSTIYDAITEIDYAAFDYNALREITKSLHSDPNRAIMLISGRKHYLELKKHFIELGFNPLIMEESKEVDLGTYHSKGFNLVEIDISRFLKQLHIL